MAPEPGDQAELHRLMIAELDQLVLKGQIRPDYEVNDLQYNAETDSWTAAVRMNLMLPMSGSEAESLPADPAVGQAAESGGKEYVWNGEAWLPVC